METVGEEQQLIQTLPDLEYARKISSIHMLIVNTAAPVNQVRKQASHSFVYIFHVAINIRYITSLTVEQV